MAILRPAPELPGDALVVFVSDSHIGGDPGCDGFGLAVFTFIGARAAYEAGVPAPIVVLMGLVTGVAGRIMRDILCREVPLILRREIYATAAIAGATVFVVLASLGATGPIVALPTVATVFGLRPTALRLDLHVPSPRPKEDDSPSADEGD